MTLPGPIVQVVDGAPPAPSLTNTGTAFIAGLFLKGRAAGNVNPADAVHSLAELEAANGARQSYNSPEFDAAESFFAEGGETLYVSRIVGPAAVIASAAVPASGSKFTAKAKGPGSYANTLTVAVASGVITIHDGSTVVEISPALADTAAAQDWSRDFSDYIDIVPLASGALSDSVAVTLSGGADDRASITDTQRQAALARFTNDLGPGQVAMPGDTRTAAHTMIAQHCLAAHPDRFGLGDLPDTATVATITSACLAVRALGRDLARHIQLLDGWLYAPGTATGTRRTIPPSGVHMGMIARSDAQGNPNRAVAGPNGISRFAIGLKNPRSDAEREAIADAGGTCYVSQRGQIMAYDDIVPVDPTVDPEWVGAAANRLVMRIVADALEIARSHMFGQVGVNLDAFNGDLKGMLAGWYGVGALYGADTADAFRVETGPSVNTTETLEARQLRAALALKIAPNARQVVIQITNTPLGAAL